MNVKDIIREKRIELGMTMKEVADKVGVSEATISRWESGEIANMRRGAIFSLAKTLNISPNEIMGWKDTPLIAAEEIAPYGKKVTKKVTEADLNKMLTSGGVLMFGDKKLTEEQKKVLLSVAVAMVKEDSDA